MAFLMLQVGEEPFSVNDIYNQFKGKSLKQDMGVVEVWDLHNERIHKLIGKEIVMVIYQKYLESQSHLKDFLRHQYKVSDMPLRGLRISFLEDCLSPQNNQKLPAKHLKLSHSKDA